MPERLGYVDPHLVLTKDREDPVHYRMNFDGQTPGVNHFVFQLAPTTSGPFIFRVFFFFKQHGTQHVRMPYEK